MRYIPLLALMMAHTACAAKDEISQANFDTIADKCGLPRSALKLRGKSELLIQPPQTSKYEANDCAMTELKTANLSVKMIFVGNEVYQQEAN